MGIVSFRWQPRVTSAGGAHGAFRLSASRMPGRTWRPFGCAAGKTRAGTEETCWSKQEGRCSVSAVFSAGTQQKSHIHIYTGSYFSAAHLIDGSRDELCQGRGEAPVCAKATRILSGGVRHYSYRPSLTLFVVCMSVLVT